jgi:hypothetical protein
MAEQEAVVPAEEPNHALAQSTQSFMQNCIYFCQDHLTRDAFRTIQRTTQEKGERGFVYVEVQGNQGWNEADMQSVTVISFGDPDKKMVMDAAGLRGEIRDSMGIYLREYNPQTQLVWLFRTTGQAAPGEKHKISLVKSHAPSPANVGGAITRA